MKKYLGFILAVIMILSALPLASLPAAAKSDNNNGDWSAKTATLKNTGEADLMVRVGDIDALNDAGAVADGYNPFSADERVHSSPWNLDASDPDGTDRIYVGSKWAGGMADGYAQYYSFYKNDGYAFGEGALTISMEYDVGDLYIRNAMLQLCIDDFQALAWESNYTVTLNGKNAPFIAELLNYVSQTGSTSYIVSAVIPSGFFEEISTGKLVITIDETTGVGDGYAVDFAKLLVNYKTDMFKGEFSGETEPGATVRLLGTSTTIVADEDGSFTFDAIPGLNAVRASLTGFVENYTYGIVLTEDTEWYAYVYMEEGTGSPDINFSQFSKTYVWSNASDWALQELEKAAKLGIIPDSFKGQDFKGSINREEFAAVAVKLYEALTGEKVVPVAENKFTDTSDLDVLKAVNVGITAGTSDSTFSPKTLLNRATAATMLTRVLKRAYIPGWTLGGDGLFTMNFARPATFADDGDIDSWAKDSVYFMAASEVIRGVGENRFAPKSTATKEAALLMAVRLVENLKDKPIDYTQSN